MQLINVTPQTSVVAHDQGGGDHVPSGLTVPARHAFPDARDSLQQTRPLRNRSLLSVSVFLLAWSVLVVYGFAFLVRYSVTSGTGDHGIGHWPADSQIVRTPGRSALLMFLHPACPCSRASVEELARLLAEVNSAIDATIVFIRPVGFPVGWERTDLWKSAESLPRVHVISDSNGVEARRFGAATSGYTLLFEPAGKLVFRGGITPARGHMGGNAGKNAIRSWVETGRAEPNETQVFGCPLFSD